jgi:hypothetical protein
VDVVELSVRDGDEPVGVTDVREVVAVSGCLFIFRLSVCFGLPVDRD